MLESRKMAGKQSEAFHTFPWHFFQVKNIFIAYRFSKVSSRPDFIFEIHQLWQSAFSRVYSNCCCSCSFEPEIIKIGQSSHKRYSNNIVNFPESTTILNACTKKSGNLWRYTWCIQLHNEYIKENWDVQKVMINFIFPVVDWLKKKRVDQYQHVKTFGLYLYLITSSNRRTLLVCFFNHITKIEQLYLSAIVWEQCFGPKRITLHFLS